MCARPKSISEYHLHKEQPARRQFDMFDLSSYVQENYEHCRTPHSHSYYQVIWFESGGGKHFVDLEAFDVGPDTLFFIARNQVHHFEADNAVQGKLIHFNDSFIVQHDPDIDILLNYALFNDPLAPFFVLPDGLEAEIRRYVDQMTDEIGNQGQFGHEALISNTLRSLLIRIEREKRSIARAQDPVGSRYLRFIQFRSLVEAHYREHWAMSDYAEQLNTTTKTLNSIVRSEYGKTATQMICDRIILEAKRRLCHTRAYINAIGYDLGFEDPSYFVKFFRKHTGVTPSDLRKALLAKSAPQL